MERMLAHAMPTPTIVRMSRNLSWMKYTLSSPAAPHTSAAACVILRLVAAATLGSRNATAKVTME